MISFPLPDNAQDSFRMVASTLFGLETLTATELAELGAQEISQHNRAVSFSGNLSLLYAANFSLRTALRIYIPLVEFDVQDEHTFYHRIKSIQWERLLDARDTLAIDTTLNTPLFSHTLYISQKTKDAIVDRFREKTGQRPSVDLEHPTLRLHVHIFGNKCSLSLDSSGESLHKRGYRDQTNKAPINEVLAAGLVILSGWDKKSTFVDAMCGSGTIAIEAAMLAANIPPGMYRNGFAAMRWKKVLPFNQTIWDTVREKCMLQINYPEVPIIGLEVSPHVTRKARENVKRAKTDALVHITHADFLQIEAPVPVGDTPTLIMNPPYGERMDQDEDIFSLYRQIGDTWKQQYKGYTCWMISSNPEAIKHIGLKAERRIPLYNGQLECRFLRFSIYEGTRRKPKKD